MWSLMTGPAAASSKLVMPSTTKVELNMCGGSIGGAVTGRVGVGVAGTGGAGGG